MSLHRDAFVDASFVFLAALVCLAPSAQTAADDRPTELPYVSSDVPLLDASYRHQDHEVVLITRAEVRPRRLVLQEGERVAWTSYSTVPSMIVFEREVARDMICHGLVNFQIEEDELRSARIHAGEFASFCELKPGRYRYKVVRPDPGNSANGARRRIEGEIVVEPRTS